MKTKLMLTFLLFWGVFFSSIQLTFAEPSQRVEIKFIEALMKKDEKLAQTYLADGVKIPTIKETTRLKGFSGLPLSKKNVYVLVAYYADIGLDGRPVGDRIALIWELTRDKDKIININVIY